MGQGRILAGALRRPRPAGAGAEDPRFATNADRVRNNDALVPLLQLAELGEAGIPGEPVLSYDEALAHPQAVARGVVAAIPDPGRGEVRTLSLPLRLGGTPAALRRRAPDLDEHGAEIRAWLGEVPGPA